MRSTLSFSHPFLVFVNTRVARKCCIQSLEIDLSFCAFTCLKVGAGQKKEKHLTKPELGHFRAQGVPLKRKLREFPVTEDGLLPVGTPISVRHFLPGQYVDITAISRGKGFQVCILSLWGLGLSTLSSFQHLIPNSIVIGDICHVEGVETSHYQCL